jgi:hypothetical protein
MRMHRLIQPRTSLLHTLIQRIPSLPRVGMDFVRPHAGVVSPSGVGVMRGRGRGRGRGIGGVGVALVGEEVVREGVDVFAEVLCAFLFGMG